jgi:hypothetical protein
METQRRRRALVVGYYLVFLAYAIFLIWMRGPEKYPRLLPLSAFMVILFGGLGAAGPIRPFSKRLYEAQTGQDDGPPLTLLGSRPAKSHYVVDERDDQMRDRAHYLAYSILRWPLILVLIFSELWIMDAKPEQVAHWLLILSVPLAVIFLSLPQAILLWTEPDIEPDEHELGGTALKAAR